MSRAKQKGTLAETAIVNYLKETWPTAERRVLSGKNDKGDITGIPNLVFEVKNQKTYSISQWLKETAIEKENAVADFGFLIIKPNGVGVSKVENWWSVLPLEDLTRLLLKAGYAQGLPTQPHTGHEGMSGVSKA